MRWEIILMICVLVIFYIGYFVFFFYVILKNSRKRKCLYVFYEILKAVHSKNLAIDDALEQIQLNYNQLVLDARIICNVKLIELLHYIIYCIDSNILHQLSRHPQKEIENKIEIRDFAQQLCQQIDNQDPFAILSEKEAAILNTIKTALDTNNSQIGNASLKQLSVELQSQEKLFIKERNKSNLATLLSIIGLVLTILFGILSFIR